MTDHSLPVSRSFSASSTGYSSAELDELKRARLHQLIAGGPRAIVSITPPVNGVRSLTWAETGSSKWSRARRSPPGLVVLNICHLCFLTRKLSAYKDT
jgi:hypothetical protein